MNLLRLLPLLLLTGCLGFNSNDMSGIMDVQADEVTNKCVIFRGNGRYDGRVSESHIDGEIYVRKGTCTPAEVSTRRQ